MTPELRVLDRAVRAFLLCVVDELTEGPDPASWLVRCLASTSICLFENDVGTFLPVPDSWVRCVLAEAYILSY